MRQALELALEWIEKQPEETPHSKYDVDTRYVVLRELEAALAQEKALQALHDENERLGLYKDAYAQPEEEKLHPVHIGVDVTREGTAVTAFYRKPNAVMEMFYSQFHPLAQPEQEPVAWMYPDALCDRACLYLCTKGFTQFPECATTPPQRTWVGLTMQDAKVIEDNAPSIQMAIFMTEATLKDKNNG